MARLRTSGMLGTPPSAPDGIVTSNPPFKELIGLYIGVYGTPVDNVGDAADFSGHGRDIEPSGMLNYITRYNTGDIVLAPGYLYDIQAHLTFRGYKDIAVGYSCLVNGVKVGARGSNIGANNDGSNWGTGDAACTVETPLVSKTLRIEVTSDELPGMQISAGSSSISASWIRIRVVREL